MVVRTPFPELAERATQLIDAARLRLLLRRRCATRCRTATTSTAARARTYHYATLYTEARLGSLIAIGKGDVARVALVPDAAHVPARRDWQTQPPHGRRDEEGARPRRLVTGGWYEWKDLRYVPSWGGSMFEALMPTLVRSTSARWRRESLGRNGAVHVEVQRRFAAEELG